MSLAGPIRITMSSSHPGSCYHLVLSGDFLLCPQSYEVTEVTKVTQASYGYFSYCPQSYEVTEVTKVTQGFRWRFSLLSPKLHGYESYGAFKKFSFFSSKSYKVSEVTKVTQGDCWRFSVLSPKLLQSLKVTQGFPHVPKVTRFQKLRGYKCCNSFTIFLEEKITATKLQSYEVTTETSVKSIHVSCHIYVREVKG